MECPCLLLPYWPFLRRLLMALGVKMAGVKGCFYKNLTVEIPKNGGNLGRRKIRAGVIKTNKVCNCWSFRALF